MLARVKNRTHFARPTQACTAIILVFVLPFFLTRKAAVFVAAYGPTDITSRLSINQLRSPQRTPPTCPRRRHLSKAPAPPPTSLPSPRAQQGCPAPASRSPQSDSNCRCPESPPRIARPQPRPGRKTRLSSRRGLAERLLYSAVLAHRPPTPGSGSAVSLAVASPSSAEVRNEATELSNCDLRSCLTIIYRSVVLVLTQDLVLTSTSEF